MSQTSRRKKKNKKMPLDVGASYYCFTSIRRGGQHRHSTTVRGTSARVITPQTMRPRSGITHTGVLDKSSTVVPVTTRRFHSLTNRALVHRHTRRRPIARTVRERGAHPGQYYLKNITGISGVFRILSHGPPHRFSSIIIICYQHRVKC